LPKSIWETLSAYANTEGGWLVLGVAERNGSFMPEGLRNPQALLKAFWDNHNNAQKLSFPMCREQDVTLLGVGEAQMLCIHVPRATRQQRPVFINGNPLTGTFKRNYEGDYRCTEAEVRRMLREAADEPLDAQVLDGFDAGDLDRETLGAFRNRFSARHPDHPFLALDEQAFLESLGAWGRDRNEKTKGLTLAGLLMFGRERSLLDALPRWSLDYREQLSSDPEVRWTYRLTPDGTWVPNLFNFYYRVMPRLVDGIATPFKLDKHATRVEETHVHEALREALVNTLVHADHRASQSIRIIKQADAFIFENPGLLRVPRDQLLQGRSDPRNANLLKMFQLLGLGERAGSGFQKIMRAWREQLWLDPLLS
jgi:ATP-dependent DNA helicase RecG